MKVIIKKSTAKGYADAPPSKSMAHRMLICGALSRESSIGNLAASRDISATVSCLQSMGATTCFDGTSAKIGGLQPENIPENTTLFCDESGSTLRFLLPLCLLADKKITLTGSTRLFERPLSVYEQICKEQEIQFEKNETGVTVCGKLRPSNYSIPGDISSQFITGLLFVLPLLAGDSTLTVTGKFESASYIDLTLSALNTFGINIQRKDKVFYIQGNQSYQSTAVCVEGDCSNAAFLEGFNLLGGAVEVRGINENSLQGDKVYSEMFHDLANGKKSFDLSDCPDLGPVLFSMAAYCGGAKFTGTARLKIKESDRATVMSEELSKFGIQTTIEENAATIHSGKIHAPQTTLNGHNDHRIVMALALLCTVTGGEIEGAQAVAKSYPDFFETIENLGIKIQKQE